MKVKRTQSLSHSWKTLSKLNLTTTFKRTLRPRKSLTPDLSHLSKEQVFSSDGFDICLGYLAYELDLKQNGQKLCIYTLQGSKKLLEGVITPLERLSTTGGCIDIDLYIYMYQSWKRSSPLFLIFEQSDWNMKRLLNILIHPDAFTNLQWTEICFRDIRRQFFQLNRVIFALGYFRPSTFETVSPHLKFP